MTKKTKITSELTSVVQLVQDTELENELGEAFSSVLINPAVSWAKFILTDDRPNENNQRIPLSEFPNLIKSGTYMPVKMAKGEIKDGHEDSEPLGVMAHLKQEGNKIVALAALWSRERPADIQYIKNLIDAGTPVNVSWEILYGDIGLGDDGVVDLSDTALRAATIVGMPAYAGRTQILAVAAKKWSPAYIKALPETSFLFPKQRLLPYKDAEGNIAIERFPTLYEEMTTTELPENELKTARQKLRRLKEMAEAGASINEINAEFHEEVIPPVIPAKSEDKLDELDTIKAAYEELKTSLAAKDTEISTIKLENETLKTSLETLNAELTSLREFKASTEKEVAKKDKFEAIRAKFKEAGLEKDEEYFAQNQDSLMGMEDSQLDFMIQELVSFAKQAEEGLESASKRKIPNFSTEGKSTTDIKELVKALNERNAR
jgi:hypothetical protein